MEQFLLGLLDIVLNLHTLVNNVVHLDVFQSLHQCLYFGSSLV